MDKLTGQRVPGGPLVPASQWLFHVSVGNQSLDSQGEHFASSPASFSGHVRLQMHRKREWRGRGKVISGCRVGSQLNFSSSFAHSHII